MHRDRSPLRRPQRWVARMTAARRPIAWYLAMLLLGTYQGVFLCLAASQCLSALGVRRKGGV